MTRRSAIGICTILAMVFGSLACGKGEQTAVEDGSRVLARVGDESITQTQLEQTLASMPKHEQAQYDGTLGRRRLLDQMVNRLLLVAAAEKQGLDRDPEVVQRLREIRWNLLTSAYRNYLIDQLPTPSEEDLRAYYDAHHEDFVVLARVMASWIRCNTKEEAEAARRRVVSGGEPFSTVAREVTVDDCSREDGGLLGYFNPEGYVPCVGRKPEFNARVFELEADDVSQVFPWDGTWAIVKVHEKTTERQEPYSKARERIAARLRPQLTDSLLTAELDRLRGSMRVETYLDPMVELSAKSAEQLIEMATQATSTQDKIDFYRALIEKYPHHERADEAQFMVGYLYSENLKDYDTARVEYQKLLDRYPDSDMRDSALYMLQNMGRTDIPALEDSIMTGETERPESSQSPGR
jgi:peptidyl-prolyl cis-trans isomerase C